MVTIKVNVSLTDHKNERGATMFIFYCNEAAHEKRIELAVA